MLCFVSALKSKQIANDWSKTSQLCEAAIRSALNQTDPNVKVLLVCHEIPEWKLVSDPRLEIIEVDLPVPEKHTKTTMKDKWTKLQRGLIRAGELNPDFVMIMDADDLVSNQISAFVHKHIGQHGWIIRRGYKYYHGSKWIEATNEFSCGTDAIVSSRLIKFPTNMTAEAAEECCILRWGHTVIADFLAKNGTPLEILPFRGAVYVTDHGDNDMALAHGLSVFRKGWRQWLRELPRSRWCSTSIKREFGIY